jgi:hypothetical protein
MAGKKEPGVPWRHTTVLVRVDIYESAQERGMDISDTCNRALAEALGIDYRQQRLDNVPVPPPVIIAKDGGLPVPASPSKSPRTTAQPPVINADDPSAAGTITHGRKTMTKKPVPEPAPQVIRPDDVQNPDLPVKKPAPKPASRSPKTPLKKPEKGDGLKTFVATRIIREDADDAVVQKEELYQFFSRWCREQKIAPVPEAKAVSVSLKTRFAFKEKVVGGSPCWVNLRLK